MKLTKSTKITLKEIQNHFDKIETLYNEIPYDIRSLILEAHSENHSLPYCIRWGKTSIDEIVKDGI